jgi:Na+(H+)/acetate symporter ActP
MNGFSLSGDYMASQPLAGLAAARRAFGSSRAAIMMAVHHIFPALLFGAFAARPE